MLKLKANALPSRVLVRDPSNVCAILKLYFIWFILGSV